MTLMCGINLALWALIVGIMASLNFFLQVTILLVNRDEFIEKFGSSYYHVFMANHFVLLIISLVMLAGVIKKNRWMLLPFLVYMILQDIGFLAVACYATSDLVSSNFDKRILIICLIAQFNFLLMLWVLWIIGKYFWFLRKNYSELGNNEV